MNVIRVGKYPYWVQNSSDGERAYVAVKGEDYVSVMDYAEAVEVAEVPVGADPMVMETRAIYNIFPH